jgi:uncharacterized protein YecE (DUF72 family)
MTNLFHLGCAVWAYKGWVGDLYPAGTGSAKFLSLYSRRFSTVECNSTFYAVPSQSVLSGWGDRTPPEFRFCPKFPRDLTHQGLLAPQISAAQNFLNQMQVLGDRLGCPFIQLPPQYGSNRFADLEEFLTGLKDTNIPLALEVRHHSWFKPPNEEKLNQLLQTHNISRVILDSRPIYDHQYNERSPELICRKPNLPVHFTTTANHVLIRYISHPDRACNQIYLQEWSSYIKSWLSQGKTIYFFVHCPQEDYSPRNAFDLQQLLELSGILTPASPQSSVNLTINDNQNPSIQMSLF